MYAYVIHTGELGRIEHVLNRTIVYMLVIISLLVLYIFSFTGLNRLFGNCLAYCPLLAGGLAVIIGLSFNPLRQGVRDLRHVSWQQNRPCRWYTSAGRALLAYDLA